MDALSHGLVACNVALLEEGMVLFWFEAISKSIESLQDVNFHIFN